jgi:hypothetical protein
MTVTNFGITSDTLSWNSDRLTFSASFLADAGKVSITMSGPNILWGRKDEDDSHWTIGTVARVALVQTSDEDDLPFIKAGPLAMMYDAIYLNERLVMTSAALPKDYQEILEAMIAWVAGCKKEQA